mgnify:CR=1 FL=1
MLEGHTTETPSELVAKRSTHENHSVLYAFERAIERMNEKFGHESLNQFEVNVLAVCSFDREINNGGFIQFFENSSGFYAPFIIQALNAIGADVGAVIVEEAIESLRIDGEPTWETLNECFEIDDEKRDDKLDELDLRYYAEDPDLCSLLLDYIEVNIQKFEFKISGSTSESG